MEKIHQRFCVSRRGGNKKSNNSSDPERACQRCSVGRAGQRSSKLVHCYVWKFTFSHIYAVNNKRCFGMKKRINDNESKLTKLIPNNASTV